MVLALTTNHLMTFWRSCKQMNMDKYIIKLLKIFTLARVAQLVEHHPIHQKVAGSIPVRVPAQVLESPLGGIRQPIDHQYK
uniref:Uncharacterized protein n=1 Tax=Myotis myotis TaxID=51298 RepID=A0A7J7U5F8_MYOMY|nr:hypothetical protein mMyoMyo1_012820 [Myotis myotis]